MKKTLLKLSALVLALALALSCISAVAFANEESYERTVLSLTSQADVSTYKWAANKATVSWDASEGALKIVTNANDADQRAQTTAFVPLSRTAQYKISFKAKGTPPERVSWFGINADDESYKTNTSQWKYSGADWNVTSGKTDENGYTEYSGTIDFKLASNTNYDTALTYCGMTRIMVNYPTEAATNYLKDFVITTNEGEGSGYVTQSYMPVAQYGGSSILGCYFAAGKNWISDSNGVYTMAASGASMALGNALSFEVNAKYRLSFDAWSADTSKVKGVQFFLFDEAASKFTLKSFDLSADRQHFDIDFSPKDIPTYTNDTTTTAYSTKNLQLRPGNSGGTFYMTNIKLAKLTEGTVDTIVNVSAGGKLTTGVYTFTNGESMPVKKGSKVSLDIAPDEGYEIASVKYNGKDVTPVSTETGSTIEFTADNDAVLNVKFSKIVPKTPEVTKGNTQTAASFVVNGETKNEFNYIQYVKIDNYDASKVSAYGVDISNGTDTLRLPAVAVMTDGSFAIRVFGAAITEDGSYTFTPYLELN